MSKSLEEKINKLFEATKDLRSLEEIKPHCEAFNEWINQQNYAISTLGSKFSKYGLYSKFCNITLVQGENAEAIAKHDAEGNIKGYELKHYVPLLCGLDKEQWNKRNHSTRSIDRLENSTEIDPDRYLEATGKLLASDDPHELAVGLVAATGRRPHEIIARAKFTLIKDKSYHVMFEGQGKKRGEKPVFEIATLYPADYVIKALGRLRKEPSTKALLKEVAAQYPKSITRQNVEIDNRRGQSLRRVVDEHFGGKKSGEPILEIRYGKTKNNNTGLRAAYAVLATERDCKGSFGAKIFHASKLLGHFAKEIKDDRDLVKLGTSAGYSDYYTTKSVRFAEVEIEKVGNVKAYISDLEKVKQLQETWNLTTQRDVVHRLLENQQKLVEVGKDLLEAKSQISQLENQIKQLQEQNNQLGQEKTDMESQPQQITVDARELESLIAQEVQRQLQQALNKMPAVQVAPQLEEPVTRVSQPTRPTVVTREKELTDWEGKTNEELWASKASGAANEKIRRSYEAICSYNDTLATGDNDRLAITNQALRELSGASTPLIGDWIKFHADEIISHNSKYGMQNSKDASKTETYYNKRHGKEKIEEILNRVKKEFLEDRARV